MNVKKISGANNHEAMMKVRSELGPDAIILHQRRVKPKGLFGYFKKSYIEIVAAIEDSVVKPKEPVGGWQTQTKQIPKEPKQQVSASIAKTSIPQQEALKAIMEKNASQQPTSRPIARSADEGLTKEITEIKSMLSSVIKKVNVNDLPTTVKDYRNKDIEKLYLSLKEQEIEDEIIINIITELVNSSDRDINKEFIEEKMKNIISNCVISRDEALKSKVIFFVGPTGVGKTTTIAKLAAHYSINEGKKIGFVSADTYRIAAVEQLKVYSEILNIPVEVIYEAGEIHQAINKLSHKDIIMVDTAGRSHRNPQQVKELQCLLDELDEKEIYLVVSCTSKNKDIKEIMDTYGFIEKYKIIITKIDEATTYGTIINTALQTQKPISYMTTGQSVPDDIEVTNAEKILSLLLEEA